MLKIKYLQNSEDSYYETIAKSKADKFNGLTFEEYYNSNYKKILKYDLKDILCGNFEKLVEIKNKIAKKDDNKLKSFFNYDKSKINNSSPLISKLQPKISKFFEENIEVHTCYYCNIDFINKFKKGKETKNGFTLDHFIDKSTYPYLALSLYNLVPSCYVCNSKIKGSKEIHDLSPTSKSFDFDDKVKFKTFMQNENLQIDKTKDFELFLKEDFTDKYQEYISILELDGRYEYHKYKVLEMIQKRREYPDSRIAELAQLTQKTIQEVKQDLFGMYLADDLHKRPLSKLIKDISEELGLL